MEASFDIALMYMLLIALPLITGWLIRDRYREKGQIDQLEFWFTLIGCTALLPFFEAGLITMNGVINTNHHMSIVVSFAIMNGLMVLMYRFRKITP